MAPFRFGQFDGSQDQFAHGVVTNHLIGDGEHAQERAETGRRTQMAKLVDVWIFDWDKYNPDDLAQKDDCFQLGPALLPALVKSGRATTCGAQARLRRPRSAPTQAERHGGQQHRQRGTPLNVC
jgi:hypothetical protein